MKEHLDSWSLLPADSFRCFFNNGAAWNISEAWGKILFHIKSIDFYTCQLALFP